MNDQEVLDTLEAEYNVAASLRDSADSYDQIITEANRAAVGRRQRNRNPQYLKRLKETAVFLKNVAQGRVSTAQLREVLSTSDFPLLFGDITDRRLLGQYAETTPVWPMYASRGTVADFRVSKLLTLDGLSSPFLFRKDELEDVQYDNNLTEGEYSTSVNVYEKGYALNWRMIVNRSLNFLPLLPQFLARGARRTESRAAVSAYVSSTGPNSTFFSAGNANIVNTTNGASSNNPPLSVQGLKDALTVMLNRTDTGGDPIEITGATLVVPPLLSITAREILRALSLEYVPATSADGVRVLTPNWSSAFDLAVEWYLPIIDQSANKHTTWYLFANPREGRAALQLTFLEGYEAPSFWQKAPNTMRMGGGGIDPVMGDFEDMSMHYKGLHILGATLLDPKMAVVSNGSGS